MVVSPALSYMPTPRERTGSGGGGNNNSTFFRDLGSSHATTSDHFGSVVDQLHAEQKSTIEALTCQVEFYRQREERHKKEAESLRRYVSQTNKGDGEEAQAVTKLSRENRLLGEEVDSLRSKFNACENDRVRLERQKFELETQLKDARLSLTGFSQAVEQLELKMQRREAEVQTKCLELEQDLRVKSQECDRLMDDSARAQQTMMNLQTTNEENARLRSELQAVKQSMTMQQTAAESSSRAKIDSLQSQLGEIEASKTRQDAFVLELQQQLITCRADLAAAKANLEQKTRETMDIHAQLQNASDLLAMREKLLTSDDRLRKDHENQRHEMMTLIATLQREKDRLQSDLTAAQSREETLESDLRTAKSRLAVKDQSVIVGTLRSEIKSLKERLRLEFKQEQESFKSEKQSLLEERSSLQDRLMDKEQLVQSLQNELLERGNAVKKANHEMMQLRDEITYLERELEKSRAKYQQLEDCRSSLAEQLDDGFKQLLHDEGTATSANEQVEKLRRELDQVQAQNSALALQHKTTMDELERVKQNRTSSTSQLNNQIDELYRQLRAKEDVIGTLKRSESKLSAVEHDKAMWQQRLIDTQTDADQRVQLEARKAERIQEQVDALMQEKKSLLMQIKDLENEKEQLAQQVRSSEMASQRSALEAESLKVAQSQMQQEIARLEDRLAQASSTVDDARLERGAREKKLLKERRQMEAEMVKLVARIDAAGKRNAQLGDKVIALMKQSKVDETDLVALSSQVKHYKHKLKQWEEHSDKRRQHSIRDMESMDDLKQQVTELACLKDTYQSELSSLNQLVDQTRAEKEVVQKQRDEAVKRVKLLMKCQEQMKATVEEHTAQLVEEIESVQDQLENERKRCAVLLANEKTLLRDLHERNAAVTKLEQSLEQQKPHHHHHHHADRSISRLSSSSSLTTTASTVSPNAGKTPRASSRDSRSSSHHLPQQTRRHSQRKSSNRPASQELDQLLSNLERISEFSSRQQQQQHFGVH